MPVHEPFRSNNAISGDIDAEGMQDHQNFGILQQSLTNVLEREENLQNLKAKAEDLELGAQSLQHLEQGEEAYLPYALYSKRSPPFCRLLVSSV